MSNVSLILLDKAWAAEQQPAQRQKSPILSVEPSGCSISTQLVREMNLKPGDQVLIAQDRQQSKDFYIMIHPRGFKISLNKAGDARISVRAYFRTMCAALGIDPQGTKRLKFKVAEKPDAINGFRCFAINTLRPLLPAPADQAADTAQGTTQATTAA